MMNVEREVFGIPGRRGSVDQEREEGGRKAERSFGGELSGSYQPVARLLNYRWPNIQVCGCVFMDLCSRSLSFIPCCNLSGLKYDNHIIALVYTDHFQSVPALSGPNTAIDIETNRGNGSFCSVRRGRVCIHTRVLTLVQIGLYERVPAHVGVCAVVSLARGKEC